MPLVKIWKNDRSVKKITMVKNLDDIKKYAIANFGYGSQESISVVFEADGTEIESNDVFECLVEEGSFPNTILMTIPEKQNWMPADAVVVCAQSTSSIFNSSSISIESVIESSPVMPPSEHIIQPNSELHNFKIPLEKLPEQFLKDLQHERVPQSSVRRDAIRKIIELIRQINTHPPRKFIERIAKEIVEQYPKSLGDAVGSKGYEHFFEQLENRLYHLNRKNKENQNLRARPLDRNISSVTPKRMRDEHGCSNWQPRTFPEGETEKTQQEKKELLKSQNVISEDEIMLCMSQTYTLQRLEINKKSSTINSIHAEWPYLFITRYFFEHAKVLIGFDIEEKWRKELSGKASKLINFFRSLSQKSVTFTKIRETLQSVDIYIETTQSAVPEECALLILLCKYFGEDESLLVQYFEKTMTEDEVLVQTSQKTKLPVLAVLGTTVLNDPECFVCVDGKTVGGRKCFIEQVIVLFTSYYIFNFHYPQNAAATLEFIQRGILMIDPIDGGHKRNGKRKRTAVHPKVHSLLTNVCTFESLWFE